MKAPGVYGLIAEFQEPTTLVAATRRAHEAGYRRMDAYSPFPIEELHEALGAPHSRLPLIVLIGGLCRGLGGHYLQYWVAAITLPIHVGGRPFHRCPDVNPGPFGCTILAAARSAGRG